LVSQLSDYHKLNQLQAKQLWQPAYYEKYKYSIQIHHNKNMEGTCKFAQLKDERME